MTSEHGEVSNGALEEPKEIDPNKEQKHFDQLESIASKRCQTLRNRKNSGTTRLTRARIQLAVLLEK